MKHSKDYISGLSCKFRSQIVSWGKQGKACGRWICILKVAQVTIYRPKKVSRYRMSTCVEGNAREQSATLVGCCSQTDKKSENQRKALVSFIASAQRHKCFVQLLMWEWDLVFCAIFPELAMSWSIMFHISLMWDALIVKFSSLGSSSECSPSL